MAPLNTHYKAATVYLPASQDAFDARLNQTVFAAAFGLAGLVFLGVVAYLSYWAVGRCKANRRASAAGEKTSHRGGRRALLLPGQLAARGKGEGGVDGACEEKIVDCARERRLFWFKKMRIGVRGAKDEHRISSEYTNRQSLVQPPPRAHLNPRISLAADFPGLLAFDAAYSPSLSDVSNSSGSEDSDGIPRIKIEDIDPGSPADSLPLGASLSLCGSDMSLEEKQDEELLAVPPMSWNAPRDDEDDAEEDTEDDICQPVPHRAQLDLRRTMTRCEGPSGGSGESKPKIQMKTALANLSNIARFRPRLSLQIPGKTKPVTALSSR